MLELLRDPIRLTLALFGAIILMFVMGYGISTDVEDLSFAVLDWDKSELSSSYVNDISGSRYFIQHRDVADYDELERRMGNGELSLVIEIPPRFGRDLNSAGRVPQIAYWLDGSMPQRAETINGYAQAIHQNWVTNYRRRKLGSKDESPIRFEPRYLYNPNNLSIISMVPAVIPLLLLMIPAVLAVFLAAFLIFRSPKANPNFTYLPWWGYLLIVLGMILLTWRITARQMKKLFSESVRKNLAGGDAQ